MKEYSVSLTLPELLLLSGQCRNKIQETIDLAKREASHGFEYPILNEVIESSLKSGELTIRYKPIASCDICGKKRQYQKFKRESKNHNKGDTNYDKPIYYSGIEFNPGFINFIGSGDCCRECADKLNFVKLLESYIKCNDLKIEIKIKGIESVYFKDDKRICFKCNKDMYESEMKSLPAVFSGRYPGGCPNCGAEQLPFGHSHKTTREFRMITTPATKKE